MAPHTRKMSFPKVVIERDSDSEPSSSEEDQEEEETELVEEEEEEEEELPKNKKLERKEEALDAKKKGKVHITISLKRVCKVKAYNYSGALAGF